MLRMKVVLYAALAFSLMSVTALAQVATPSVYAGFLGKWSGTDTFFRSGHKVMAPVTLVVSLTKKQDKMRFDCVYGTKGETDYYRYRKLVTLDISHAVMGIENDDEDNPTHYKLAGLDHLSANGIGSFVATVITNDTDSSSISRCSYLISKDQFSYRWEDVTRGQNPVLRSIFNFNRN